MSAYGGHFDPAANVAVVAAYGDSIVRGWNPDVDYVPNPWPVVVAADLKITVYNEGVNSKPVTALVDGTDGVHPPFITELANKGNVTHVLLGHCSASMGAFAIATFKTALGQLVDAARNAGKTPVVVTPNPCNLFSGTSDQWIVAMRDVAAAKNCALIDCYAYLWDYAAARGISTASLNATDNIHPSASTYVLMGHWIATQLKPLL